MICERLVCTVSWGCRIHRMNHFRGIRPRPNECPGYDTKESDGEVPLRLEYFFIAIAPKSTLAWSGST